MSALEDLLATYEVAMSPAETGQVLGTSAAAVQRQLRAGELPGYRINHRWVVLREELKAYMLRNQNAAAR